VEDALRDAEFEVQDLLDR